MTLVRVKNANKDFFVEVPDLLYEKALQEKKSRGNYLSYCFAYKNGFLKQHNRLSEFIAGKIGRNFFDDDIERIHVVK